MDKVKSGRVLDVLKQFIETPLDDELNRHLKQSPAANAIALFHDIVKNVPAYQGFLEKKTDITNANSDHRRFQAFTFHQ